MPINIYKQGQEGSITWLCDKDWGLASQVYELEEWLNKNVDNLMKAEYVADIGFSGNKDAAGGGGIITIKLMEMLTSIGMEVHLSEYPFD